MEQQYLIVGDGLVSSHYPHFEKVRRTRPKLVQQPSTTCPTAQGVVVRTWALTVRMRPWVSMGPLQVCLGWAPPLYVYIFGSFLHQSGGVEVVFTPHDQTMFCPSPKLLGLARSEYTTFNRVEAVFCCQHRSVVVAVAVVLFEKIESKL